MADQQAQVVLGADISGATSGMADAAKAVQASVEQMKGSFAALGNSVEFVKNHFAALGAILAGGVIFRDAVDTTKNLTVESIQLGRQLGITATEASILRVALEEVHVSSDTYMHAVTMLGRQLKTNESGLNALGIATRDGNGHLLNQQTIMDAAIKKMQEFKEGTDRNQYAMYVFGRGAAEVAPLVKLNADVMADATEKASRLGLVVTDESEAAVKDFRHTLVDINLVFDGFKNAIGQAVIPVLTQLGQWFVAVGVPAVEALRDAFTGLSIVVHAFSAVAIDTFAAISAAVQISVRTVQALSDAVFNVVTGNFSRLKVEGIEAWEDISRIIREQIGVIKMNGEEFDKYLEKVLSGDSAPTKKKAEGKNFKAPEGEGPSRVPLWKAELEQGYEDRQEYFKKDLALEEEFWQGRKALAKNNQGELVGIAHELFIVHKAIAKEKYDAQVAAIHEEMAMEKQSLEHKQALAEQAKKIAVAAYGEESKEASKANHEVLRIWAERAVQQQRLANQETAAAVAHGQAMLAIDRENLAFAEKMGAVSVQDRLAVERGLIEQDYTLRRAGLERQLSFTGLLTKEETAKLNAELDALDDERRLKLTKNQNEAALDTKKIWDQVFGSIESAFENAAKGIAQGTETLRQAMRNIGNAIVGEFISLGVKMVANWAKNQLLMTGATAAGTASRLALESWAAIQSIAIASWAAIKKIAIWAWESAAGAYNAVVSIPYIGPFLAPAMATAAAMAVLGFGSHIMSAEGGAWDIPRDQLAMVHKNESILPADKSKAMDEMLSGGGSGDMHFHVHAAYADTSALRKFFNENGHVMADALKTQIRDFRV